MEDIRHSKKYFNQKYVISEIRTRTGCSRSDISKILNALGDVVKDTFGSLDDDVEIKLFPGLKLSAKYLPPEQSRSNFSISDCGFILRLGASFSNYFRKEIRTLHQSNLTESKQPN